jgi:hypothetical protein
MSRRFPAPWIVVGIEGGFRVEDSHGIALVYIYARDDLAKGTTGNAWLTSDEARRIAVGIARLPELLVKK